MKITSKEWGTKAEKKYLDTIGTSHLEVAIRTSKKELLKRYIRVLALRKEGGDVNIGEVWAYANKLLSQMPE